MFCVAFWDSLTLTIITKAPFSNMWVHMMETRHLQVFLLPHVTSLKTNQISHQVGRWSVAPNHVTPRQRHRKKTPGDKAVQKSRVEAETARRRWIYSVVCIIPNITRQEREDTNTPGFRLLNCLNAWGCSESDVPSEGSPDSDGVESHEALPYLHICPFVWAFMHYCL